MNDIGQVRCGSQLTFEVVNKAVGGVAVEALCIPEHQCKKTASLWT